MTGPDSPQEEHASTESSEKKDAFFRIRDIMFRQLRLTQFETDVSHYLNSWNDILNTNDLQKVVHCLRILGGFSEEDLEYLSQGNAALSVYISSKDGKIQLGIADHDGDYFSENTAELGGSDFQYQDWTTDAHKLDEAELVEQARRKKEAFLQIRAIVLRKFGLTDFDKSPGATKDYDFGYEEQLAEVKPYLHLFFDNKYLDRIIPDGDLALQFEIEPTGEKDIDLITLSLINSHQQIEARVDFNTGDFELL